ncbi:MAG: hypothetical protein JWN52_86 [Actinomycetia bacterium]|nr:hypothetical protein [Actinomycetes bacterium]
METLPRLLAVSAAPGHPGPAPETLDPGLTGEAAALVLNPRDHSYAALSTADLRKRVTTGEGLAEIAAPFAAVASDGASLTIAADQLGLRQLYGVRGDGWAAVSTSARRLGLLAGAGLDRDALGVYRLIGHHLDEDTAFSGVVKMPAGHRWTLADGRLTETPCPAGDFATDRVPTVDEAVRELTTVLRTAMERCLDEYPDAVLQLSGGLDTRMLLAAIPPARRTGLRALTLGSPDNSDHAAATVLAERYQMRRDVIDLAALGRLEPAEVHRLVQRAGLKHEQVLSPIHFGMLEWVEEQTSDVPRISGFGGELARGMYYPLQRQHPRVTPRLVERLARWRIFSLDPVDSACLDADFARESEAAALDRLQTIFAGYGTDWLSATDAYYYRQRYHRAVGAVVTSSCLEHTVLSPLLHPRFVAIAEALPPEAKRGSAFNARVLAALDPELAAIPMDTGVRPDALMAPRPVALARTGRDYAVKASHKIRQRVFKRGDSGAVTSALTGSLVAHWRAYPGLLEPVAATGLLSQEWLERLLSGEITPAPVTAGFVALLEAATSSKKAE